MALVEKSTSTTVSESREKLMASEDVYPRSKCAQESSIVSRETSRGSWNEVFVVLLFESIEIAVLLRLGNGVEVEVGDTIVGCGIDQRCKTFVYISSCTECELDKQYSTD